jgi:hypothetical protein
MNQKRKRFTTALLGVSIFCSALAAQSLLSKAAATPPSPGCGYGATAGTLCQVNSDGCEVWQGINAINTCNTGTGSQHMWVFHEILPTATGQFRGVGSSGNSAYATLWCSDNGQRSVLAGLIHPNDVIRCPTFALRSVCGYAAACGAYTN